MQYEEVRNCLYKWYDEHERFWQNIYDFLLSI